MVVPEWVVRMIVFVSGMLNIFTAVFVMLDSSFLGMRIFLVLIGILVIVGSATFESWTPADKK